MLTACSGGDDDSGPATSAAAAVELRTLFPPASVFVVPHAVQPRADGASVESLIEGKEATLKMLTTVLQQFGIEEVDPEGEPFDPELHEAISMQPSDSVEPGSVVTVVQKGYTLNGRLLRPAMVIVAAEA